jgi:hypothetical protein
MRKALLSLKEKEAQELLSTVDKSPEATKAFAKSSKSLFRALKLLIGCQWQEDESCQSKSEAVSYTELDRSKSATSTVCDSKCNTAGQSGSAVVCFGHSRQRSAI